MKVLMIFLLIFNYSYASLIERLKLESKVSEELIINENAVKNGDVIGISSTWVNIFKVKTLNQSYWCLNYQIPYTGNKVMLGTLRMLRSLDCQKDLLIDSEYKIKNIKILSLRRISPFKYILKINNDELELNQENEIKILAWNGEKRLGREARGAGLLKDSKDILICHDFNKLCQETVANFCSDCRYGWFSGAASECGDKVTKYCGISECGTKNMPACPRGETFTEIKGLLGCQNESLSGFCQKGLVTVCENGQLYCR